MILDKTIMVRWNGSTKKWYEEKSYIWTKVNDYFECKIEDVMPTSTAKVNMKCDYCGKTFIKEFRVIQEQREIINKDCCKKCKNKKQEDVMFAKYGVRNNLMLDSVKDNISKKLRTPFSEVEDLCKEKGLELLNKENDYHNERSRLKVICNNHKDYGIQETNFANIKKNKHCCKYIKTEITGDLKRKDGIEVYNDFIKAGLVPKFNPEEYAVNSQQLPFICKRHKDKGIQYRQYSNLKYSLGCIYCSHERTAFKLRLDKNFVFNQFKSKGLFPLEDERYKDKNELIQYKCIKHPEYIQKTSYGSFKVSNQCCSYCRAEESISKLNRKLRSSIGRWVNDSKKYCGYKCILTGSEEYEVHHLYSYNEIIKEVLSELGLDIKDKYSGDEIIKIRDKVIKNHNNHPLGVCLHKDLHILFHQLYSKENNIPSQFKEFTTRLKSGEFNDFLKENNLSLKTTEVILWLEQQKRM